MRRRLRRWLAARLHRLADVIDSPISQGDYRLGLGKVTPLVHRPQTGATGHATRIDIPPGNRPCSTCRH